MPSATAGNVTVEWDDTFEDWAKRAAGLPGTSASVLEAVITSLWSDAASKWPVDTGRSRAGLIAEISQTADIVTAFITNRVPYAQFVPFDDGLAFDRLVIAPGEQRIPGITRLLSDAILDELEG